MSTNLKCYSLPTYFRVIQRELFPEVFDETLEYLIKLEHLKPFKGIDYACLDDFEKKFKGIFHREGIYLIRMGLISFIRPIMVLKIGKKYSTYYLSKNYFNKQVEEQSPVCLTDKDSKALHSVWHFLTNEQKDMWFKNRHRIAVNRTYFRAYKEMRKL